MSRLSDDWPVPTAEPIGAPSAAAPHESLPPPPTSPSSGPRSLVAPLGGLADWAVGLVVVVMLAEVVAQVGVLGRLGLLGPPWPTTARTITGVAAAAVFPGVLVAGVVFLCWFSRAYANLSAMGRFPAYSSGWAVGAWFVPFLNFIRPKQITEELWLDSGYPRQRSTALVTAWWTLWVLNRVVGAVTYSESADPDFGWWVALESAGTLLAVGAGVALIRIVRVVTAGQHQHVESALGEPSPAAPSSHGPDPFAPPAAPPSARRSKTARGPGSRARVVAATGSALLAAGAMGWFILQFDIGGPTPTELTEAQLESLLLEADDLDDGWWELPPIDDTELAAHDDATDAGIADGVCDADFVEGPTYSTADEMMFLFSVAEESCGTTEELLRDTRLSEAESVELSEERMRRIGTEPDLEFLGTDGGQPIDDLEDGTYGLEVTGDFQIDGRHHSLHSIELGVFADHGVVSIGGLSWDEPIPSDLQRELAAALRAKLDALAEDVRP